MENKKIYKYVWNGKEQKEEFNSMKELKKFLNTIIFDNLDIVKYRIYERKIK